MPELTRRQSKPIAPLKQRNYNEIVEYLDAHWSIEHNTKAALERVRKLHQLLGNPASKFKTILIGGTNGKSLTAVYCAKLLRLEGLSVGTFSSPHILTYNERISLNQESMSNKQFAEVVNEAINAIEQTGTQVQSQELLLLSALNYFAHNDVDVAVLEVDKGGTLNPTNICQAAVAAITRITPEDTLLKAMPIEEHINDILGIIKAGTFVVSADQSKVHLQMMENITQAQGGTWAMPIRKLATLPYPFEQLHGRCAALAERVCQIFAEHFLKHTTSFASDSLLIKQKGTRGRPTREQKRQSELNPKKTLDQVWREDITSLPGRFQLLDKEKPSILLDNASNIDAFKNLLLGIRLFHYQKPLKGLTIIVGSTKGRMNSEEFLKLTRYFFKKTSGQLLICPVNSHVPKTNEGESWNVDQVTNDVKSMKIKARACGSFAEAFELAKKSVDDRNGLVVITGSTAIIHEFWYYKGIKKF